MTKPSNLPEPSPKALDEMADYLKRNGYTYVVIQPNGGCMYARAPLGLYAMNTAHGDAERLAEALEHIAESHDAGRYDGKPEPMPAHDADTMFGIATKALDTYRSRPHADQLTGEERLTDEQCDWLHDFITERRWGTSTGNLGPSRTCVYCGEMLCRDDCVLNEVVKRLRSIATGEDLLTEEERVVVDGARNWNTVRYGQDAQFLRCATRDLLAIIDRIAPAPTTTTDQ